MLFLDEITRNLLTILMKRQRTLAAFFYYETSDIINYEIYSAFSLGLFLIFNQFNKILYFVIVLKRLVLLFITTAIMKILSVDQNNGITHARTNKKR